MTTQNMQVNPIEAARFALLFLSRVQFNASERHMYDISEALLQAIVAGRVQLVEVPQTGNGAGVAHPDEMMTAPEKMI
jgi:hypothetical protein